MNCRIDKVVSGDGSAVFSISGRLSGRHVSTLRRLLEGESRAVTIDLKEVVLIDRQGVKLLGVSETRGAELRHCPTYIREWVDRERAHTSPEPSGVDTDTREENKDE